MFSDTRLHTLHIYIDIYIYVCKHVCVVYVYTCTLICMYVPARACNSVCACVSSHKKAAAVCGLLRCEPKFDLGSYPCAASACTKPAWAYLGCLPRH